MTTRIVMRNLSDTSSRRTEMARPARGGLRRVSTSRFSALLEAGISDLDVIVDRDPSVRSRGEALLHPALPAVWSHRLAHVLHRRGRRLIARALSTLTRMSTGVEIHPGASIGRRFFIDHGCGVVIGETAVIGDDVTLYHQVTLGAVGWWHDRERPAGARRHPEIGDGVVLGANATVLGPVSIGARAVVGAQALVLDDVPPDARVLAPLATLRRRGSISAPSSVGHRPHPHRRSQTRSTRPRVAGCARSTQPAVGAVAVDDRRSARGKSVQPEAVERSPDACAEQRRPSQLGFGDPGDSRRADRTQAAV